MTDDSGGPAAGEPPAADPDSTADPAGRDPAGQQPGIDRRSLVYLVPTISGSADADSDTPLESRRATPPAAPAVDARERVGGGGGGAPGQADLLDQDQDPDLPAEPAEREDWAWVQEWRAGHEPTPWATGIALATFSALLVGVAVWVLSAGLADRPVIAVLVNILVAAGLTPAIWLSRGLPVLRWVAAGAAAGIIIGWISAILMLPFPTA